MKQRQNNMKPELARRWFKKALDDEQSIGAILEDQRGSPNTACFLAQQMSEKYLKGFLAFHDKRVPKIHQLDRLLKLCKEVAPSMKTLQRLAEELSEFYVATRYPDDFQDFSFTEAAAAFRKANKIKSVVLQKTGI